MFENLDAGTLLVVALLSLLISMLILHSIIRGASQSDKVVHHLKLQNALLIKMLTKSGANQEEIDEVVSSVSPQKPKQ